MKRVVRKIEAFQEPHKAKTNIGYTTTICAVGRYKHPAGWRPCGLEAHKLKDGSWTVGGWTTLEPIGDYGTPETAVEPGEHVPWYRKPENAALVASLKENYTKGSETP